jgi:hypothetical protein
MTRFAATVIALAFALGTSGAIMLRAAAAAGPEPLVGTFRITAGSCAGGKTAGSRFRMVVPTGGPGGPYVSNNDSTCSDHSYTLLSPGTDGGLQTGTRQPEPSPAFDGSGNSLAKRITKPARFYGVLFSTSTNAIDPQTGAHVAAPTLAVQNGAISGDLRAFAASWNRQEFNQGAPKPDGSTPGNTARPSGHYNADTGAFTLDWASQIKGGPFNNFTGLWHFEGTFVPATSTSGGSSGSSASHDTTGASSGTTAGGTPADARPGTSAEPSATPLPSGNAGDLASSSDAQRQGAAGSGSTDVTKTRSRGSTGPIVGVIVGALALAGAGALVVVRRRSAGSGA